MNTVTICGKRVKSCWQNVFHAREVSIDDE